MKILLQIISYPFIILIKMYQFGISPLIGSNCRYVPTCSAYSLEAIKKYGIFKGGFLSAKRIASCHPRGGSGFNPVP